MTRVTRPAAGVRGIASGGPVAHGTPFIGRAAELQVAAELLTGPATRILTLTGPAGVGKTRLALELARRTLPAFPGGAVFVPLADLHDPGGLPAALLRAVGGADRDPRDAVPALVDRLAGRALLLLLDNVEQIAHGSGLLTPVVESCPELTVLVTSRCPLGLRAERCLPVGPLGLPPAGQVPADRALQSDAVAFLVGRLEAVDGRFTLHDEDLPSVVGICRRLDGLPLALELAAARSRVLPVRAILAALEEGLPLLTLGNLDMPERQRTMAGALDWSYRLLDPTGAAVFRRLGASRGGADRNACEALAGDLGLDPVQLLDALDGLVCHSLIHRTGEAPARFGMLEVVREFAAGQLAAAGEERAARRRHALHYLALAEQAQLAGPDQAAWLDRLQPDAANFTAAVRWAVDEPEADLALRLCLALRFLWYVRGSIAEARSLFAEALALPGARPALRGRALVEAAALARHHGDLPGARHLTAEALRIARQQGGPKLLGAALLQHGFVLHLLGDYPGARSALEESLAISHGRDDRLGVARALHHLGLVAYFGDADTGLAWELQARGLALFRELGNQRHVAATLISMGELARARGEPATARELLAEAVGHVRRLDDTPLLAFALHPCAALAADQGQLHRALRLIGAAEGLERASGAPAWPALAAGQAAWLPSAERRVGPNRTAALREAGRRLTPGQAAELATCDDDRPDLLTDRERQVAVLVAEGLTNRAIAERLVVSTRTVDGHVAAVLAKLGFATRAQIAGWVAGGPAEGQVVRNG